MQRQQQKHLNKYSHKNLRAVKVFTALFNQIKENIMKMKYNGIADAAARFVEKEQPMETDSRSVCQLPR